MHKAIKMLDLVLSPMVFIFLFNGGRHVEVLKFVKNDHLKVFLSNWLLLLRFLGMLRRGLY